MNEDTPDQVQLVTWQQALDAAALVFGDVDTSDRSPTSAIALFIQMHRAVEFQYAGSVEGMLEAIALADFDAATDAVTSVVRAARDEFGVDPQALLHAARAHGPRAQPAG